MGVPYCHTDMTRHPQYVTVRNERGKEMFDMIRRDCDVTPSVSSGERKPFVMQTVISDDEATLGRGPEEPAPLPVGKAIAWLLEKIGPKGKEFGMYSLDYHTIRNYLYVKRTFGEERAMQLFVPDYAGSSSTSTTSTAPWTEGTQADGDATGGRGASEADAKWEDTGAGGRTGRGAGRGGRRGARRSFPEFLRGADPGVVGGVVGFLLFTTLATKLMS